MAQTFKTIKVHHVTMGEVKVKVDSEDFETLREKRLYVKVDNSASSYVPKIAIIEGGELTYAHRFILSEHNMLDVSKNCKPKNGDFFDLRKKNFI